MVSTKNEFFACSITIQVFYINTTVRSTTPLQVGLSEKHRHDFYGEAALLGQFKHANVIALHGVILQG